MRLKWKAEIVDQRLAAPIVRVTFKNVSGDTGAAPVGEVIREVIRVHQPLALVIDLSQAHYNGGDGICGLVVAVACSVRLAIVAHGDDGSRILHTLQTVRLLQAFGGKLFASVDDAVEYLNERLRTAG